MNQSKAGKAPGTFVMQLYTPILITENDEEDRQLMTAALQKIHKSPSSVRFFPSGIELLQYLDHLPEGHTPALLVLDQHMPILDGKQTLALIRAHEVHHDVPVVIYSSVSTLSVMEEFKDLNVLACIQKGQNFDKVVEQMRYFFELIADDVETLLGD